MASNDFLPFGGGAGANVIDQATYAALTARLAGFQSGVAQSAQLNKVWRQSSIMAAVLAQFIVDQTGSDAIDEGTIATLLANLKQAIPNTVNAVGVDTENKLNGVNSPNLLFNGSGEFGAAGWFLSGPFIQLNDAAGGYGSYFASTSSLSSFTNSCASPHVQIGAGVSICAGIDVANGATSGAVSISLVAMDSAGNAIADIGNPVPIPNEACFTRYYLSGTTPNGTTFVQIYIDFEGVTAPVNSVCWRRLKIEQGNLPSLYSQEASTAKIPGRLLGVRKFTQSGTYTPTPGTTSIIVEAVGGGGGGGGCAAPASGQGAVGGAGTSATYSKSRFTSGFYGGVSVTIGAGGKGGAAGANAGLNGGSTSFGTLLAAAGGAGGARGPAVVPPIFSGANANQPPLSPGGNILQMPGNVSIGSMLLSPNIGTCAAGGNSPLGMGGGAHGLAGAGVSGTGYGSGGSGAISYSGGIAYPGGNGAPGVVIISEYA
jgi:hypothetical protein